MGNVIRLADDISCGDHAASGSGNVFASGMPVVTRGKNITTGHDCFPPTTFIGPWSSTVFVNNEPVALKNKTRILVHRCGKSWHDGVAISGSATVFIEE